MAKYRRRGVTKMDFYEHPKFKTRVDIYLDKNDGEFEAEYANENYKSKDLSELKAMLRKAIEANSSLEWHPVIEVTFEGSKSTIGDVRKAHEEEAAKRYEYVINTFDDASAELSMKVSRYWVAQRTDGEWMVCKEWYSKDYEAEGKVCGRDDRIYSRRINMSSWDIWVDDEKGYHSRRANGAEIKLPFHNIRKNTRYNNADIHYLNYSEELWEALNLIGDKIGELKTRLEGLVATDKNVEKLVLAFAGKFLTAGKGE